MNSRRRLLEFALLSAASLPARAGMVDWYNGVKVGSRLPAYETTFLNGAPPAQAPLTLIDFWATWCAPCRESIPRLNSLYESFLPRGLSVLGFTQESPEVARPFLLRVPAQYPVGAGGPRPLQPVLGIKALPYAVFVSAASIIVWRGQPDEIDGPLVEFLLKSAA